VYLAVRIERGPVAVATGAAQGLGRALAAGLIDRGVSVVLADNIASLAGLTERDVLTEHLSTEQREQLWARLKRGIATMMEPEVAAERILAAVEANRLYALTHGDFEDGVRHRAEGILAALGDRG